MTSASAYSWPTGLRILLISALLAALCRPVSFAQSPSQILERKSYERYLTLLKRQPRRGAAFDKVYSFHVDAGSLDDFVGGLTSDSRQPDADGTAALILGMVQMRRGDDAAAAQALTIAAQQRPDDPVAAWYLGQALQDSGDSEAAAQVLQQAIDRKPAKVDLIEIYELLGRIYQRTHRKQDALTLWARFESEFPDDLLVKAQIAAILRDEGDIAAALPRFESLSQSATDPFQKIDYAINAADLKLKLGRRDAAVADFEALLQQLKPGGWQFADVRRRIELAFLADNDRQALIEYYQNRLRQNPSDLETMTAIGRQLSAAGQHDEAREWLQKAVQKAPTDVKLRQALIEQLVAEDNITGAVRQYEELAARQLTDAALIERWGQLWMQNAAVPETTRRAKAAEVWEQLLALSDGDAAKISHTADLFRSAGMTDAAIALYRWAIAVAPQNPQYREYLGEYFHQLQRSDDAVQVWRDIAAGDRKTTASLVRLSEVFQSFGYDSEAIAAIQEACELQPAVADYLRLVTLLRDAKRFDDAQKQLHAAESVATTDVERQQIQQEAIQTDLAAGRLTDRIAQLRQQANDPSQQSADQWQKLALYQEVAGQLPDAARSINTALQHAADSSAAWSVAARIQEKAGLLADAAAAHAKLAELDRRNRVEHLQKVSTLQQQLGRVDEALQAAGDVIQAAPDNPEAYRFFADMCFQLNNDDMGIDALRQCVRVNPGDVETLMVLAENLADRFRTDEATELYWRAFEKTQNAEQQTSIIQRLTALYLRTSRFDRLVDRLDTLSQADDDPKPIQHCKAIAYQAAGHLPAAQLTLEQLLKRNPRDANLLKDVSVIAALAQNLPAAIEYQQQLVDVLPSTEASTRLAELLLRAGRMDEAHDVFAALSGNDVTADTSLSAIDQLIRNEQLPAADKLLQRLSAADSRQDEVLLRQAIIAWKQQRHSAVSDYCEQILALPVLPNSNSEVRSPVYRTDVARRVLYDLELISTLPPHLKDRQDGLPWQSDRRPEIRTVAVALLAVIGNPQHDREAYLRDMLEAAKASLPQQTQSAWDFYDAVTITNELTAWENSMIELFSEIREPDAQSVVLHSLLRSAESQLSAAQGLQLVSAYQQLRPGHAAWLEDLGGVRTIIDALERSHLAAEAQQIRVQLAAQDASLPELKAACSMAVSGGDVPTALNLVERLIQTEQSSATTSANRDSTLDTLGWTFAQLASTKAAQQDFNSVAELLTKFLQVKSSASAGHRSREPLPDVDDNVVTRSHRTFTAGKQSNSLRVTTLPEDRRWGSRDITFLVNLHALYGDERWNELVGVVESFIRTTDAAQSEAIVTAELALAHLYTLHGDADQAAVHLVRAAALDPADARLRLTLARYYGRAGNLPEALALLDTISAVDHNIVRQQELLALELASTTGNPARARIAAERLFGLRLDSATSLKLASRMQTLGLNELADALLNRTRKTSGNEIETLVSLMEQYAERSHTDVAAEIAHQILRQTDTGTRRSAAAESAHEAAVKTLARTGQLNAIIQRTEVQLQTTETPALMRSLVEFYKAAGRDDDALQMSTRLSEREPESIDNLLRLAGQYEKSRNPSAACDHYLQVLKRDPQRFTQNYYQYLRTFQNAGRLPDLADVLLAVDIRKLHNNYYVISETIEYLFHEFTAGTDPENRNRDKGLELLAAAWKAFPGERSYLLNNIRDPKIWNRPEMFQYAREGLMPSSIQQAIARPWQGIADAPTFAANGDIIGTLSRVLKAMPDEQRLQEFTVQVEDTVQQFPRWHGGRLILSVLKAKAGNTQAAESLLTEVMNDVNVGIIPVNTAWLIGAELEKQGERFLPMITGMLKNSLTPGDFASRSGYLYSAGRRLALLEARQGHREAARQAVLRTMSEQTTMGASGADPGEQAWQQITDHSDAAATLAQLGFPFDAVAMYHRITDKLLAESARHKNDGSSHRRHTEAQAAKATLLRTARADALIEFLSRRSDQTIGIDLILTAPEHGMPIQTDNSSILTALKNHAQGPSVDAIAVILTQRLQAEADTATSTAVAAWFFGDEADRPSLKDQALQSLISATQKQDTVAGLEQDVAVWFVARRLLTTSDHQETAAHLADFAEAAAMEHRQLAWLQAMLKERGELAISVNNAAAAEQAWSRLLNLLVPAPSTEDNAATSSVSAVQELRQRLLNTATNKE
ncbi:MAG: tetratricopeptide repeat protein [Planctomycetaceae bacterium]